MFSTHIARFPKFAAFLPCMDSNPNGEMTLDVLEIVIGDVREKFARTMTNGDIGKGWGGFLYMSNLLDRCREDLAKIPCAKLSNASFVPAPRNRSHSWCKPMNEKC
jgi:hypothetical protein